MKKVIWICRAWDVHREVLREEGYLGDMAEDACRRMAKYLSGYGAEKYRDVKIYKSTRVTKISEVQVPQ